MGFTSKLRNAWASNNSMLCVGLDPDVTKFPPSLRNEANGIERFCINIIDATHDLVCAFKPQIAYFSSVGAEDQLERICNYIRTNYPDVVLILDAKRGDIGDTATQYAREAFDRYGADAVTVNPYLGTDTLQPFFAHNGKGVIIICRTSNPGSGEFQLHEHDGEPMYVTIAKTAASTWAKLGDCALVVGATYPDELRQVREIVGDMPILVPGIGAQGGNIASAVKNGSTSDSTGLIINSSRAILYASNDDATFALSARAVATRTRDEIRATIK
ncbi:MAG: orotidine-5'-phosphate decarboxylase [Ilumatobacteraceae bacterium]